MSRNFSTTTSPLLPHNITTTHHLHINPYCLHAKVKTNALQVSDSTKLLCALQNCSSQVKQNNE